MVAMWLERNCWPQRVKRAGVTVPRPLLSTKNGQRSSPLMRMEKRVELQISAKRPPSERATIKMVGTDGARVIVGAPSPMNPSLPSGPIV